ncbi:MAG TPA: SRPBCC family protein [Spongiibacteraceae bacterium]|nr:SRPBCC family protein [Spongiibacteraceae bacterium]
MIKKILIAVALAVVAVLVFAATKPDTFSVQRAIAIKAPPEKIFPLLNDFHSWGLWSPYEKLDPAMQRTFSDPASGVGAVYQWESDGQGGVGSMEITRATAPTLLALNLNFVKPFATRNTVEFALQPAGNSTMVTWTMRGPSPYVAKVMQVFFNMDSMVGKDFETGLADLKAVAEK